MKSIKAKISIKNLSDDKSYSQHIAGGIPKCTDELKEIFIDGETDEEILYKLIINLFACYSLSINNYDEWIEKLREYKNLLDKKFK